MSTKDTEIRALMHTLKISKEEAEELYDFDHNKINNDIADNLDKKAKANIRPYEQSKPTKTVTTRERKVNEEKKFILENVKSVLERIECTDINTKTETEIKFIFNENKYTIKLTKHKKVQN